MELRHPVLIFIFIIAIICYIIFTKKKKTQYTNGSKIANTHYLKNTDYFKKRLKLFYIFRYTLIALFAVSALSSVILISRLSKVETVNIEQNSRDIFLCMDTSTSVDELNIELVDNLKKTVDKLNGERFGISIFNTSSVTLVPLTDDYDYVKDILDKIKESIKANNSIKYGSYTDTDYFYVTQYICSGTTENYETRGSSLIGDGLASCVYSFSNLEEERTRIIIFSTDNALSGTPLVTLDKAATISKSKNIKVFGIGTKIMGNNDKIEFKKAVEKTGGKFYEHSNSTVNGIVNDIEATSKTLLKNQIETKQIDIPQIPFIILLLSIIGIIICKKVIS